MCLSGSNFKIKALAVQFSNLFLVIATAYFVGVFLTWGIQSTTTVKNILSFYRLTVRHPGIQMMQQNTKSEYAAEQHNFCNSPL